MLWAKGLDSKTAFYDKNRKQDRKLGKTAANATSLFVTRCAAASWRKCQRRWMTLIIAYRTDTEQTEPLRAAQDQTIRLNSAADHVQPWWKQASWWQRSEIANDVKTCLGNNPWSVSWGLRHQLSKRPRPTFNWATWDLTEKVHAEMMLIWTSFKAKTILA